MGLELQLEELIEQRERARVQRRPEDVARLEQEIAALQGELARTAELVAEEGPPTDGGPEFHDGEKLRG